MYRKQLESIVAVLFAALLATACYRPQRIAGPIAPAALVGSFADPASVPELRLHVFNTGMNRMSPLLVGSPSPWRPVPAFVIEHPSRGLVVFDCGLGPEVATRGQGALHPLTRFLIEVRSAPGRDLAAQMSAAGLEPERVSMVVLSHLHFDHTGSLPAFRNADVVVGRGAREDADARLDGFEPAHTESVPASSWKEIDFADLPAYATFEHVLDLFGDQTVFLIGGGGHARGGVALLLDLPRGPVLLAGDEVVHFDWLKSDDVQRIVHDAARAADFRNRVRRLRELVPRLSIFPGHDLPTEAETAREDIVIHDPAFFRPQAWPRDS